MFRDERFLSQSVSSQYVPKDQQRRQLKTVVRLSSSSSSSVCLCSVPGFSYDSRRLLSHHRSCCRARRFVSKVFAIYTELQVEEHADNCPPSRLSQPVFLSFFFFLFLSPLPSRPIDKTTITRHEQPRNSWHALNLTLRLTFKNKCRHVYGHLIFYFNFACTLAHWQQCPAALHCKAITGMSC